jgi:elongation factor 1-alpha
LLVVSAVRSEFEESLGKGGLSRVHMKLCRNLGIENIIVLVNKMDHGSVKYSEERFNEVKEMVQKYMEKVGIDYKCKTFVPVSGVTGENLVDKSENMEWYKGPTLFQAIVDSPKPLDLSKKSVRFCMNDVYKISGLGTVPVGRVQTGIMKQGMNL